MAMTVITWHASTKQSIDFFCTTRSPIKTVVHHKHKCYTERSILSTFISQLLIINCHIFATSLSIVLELFNCMYCSCYPSVILVRQSENNCCNETAIAVKVLGLVFRHIKIAYSTVKPLKTRIPSKPEKNIFPSLFIAKNLYKPEYWTSFRNHFGHISNYLLQITPENCVGTVAEKFI